VRDGEAFDRGVALVQLDVPADRIKCISREGSGGAKPQSKGRRHLDRLSGG